MIYNDSIPFEHYFTYHPPITQERIDRHEKINNASMQLARVVWDYLPTNDKQRNTFLNQIQFMRMMLNQAVTVAEIKDELENNSPASEEEDLDAGESREDWTMYD